ATNVGGPREILAGAEAGLLLPPREPDRWAQEAARLLQDPQRRVAMGAKGRAIAERRFTRDAHLAEVLAGYTEVLARPGGGNGHAPRLEAGERAAMPH